MCYFAAGNYFFFGFANEWCGRVHRYMRKQREDKFNKNENVARER